MCRRRIHSWAYVGKRIIGLPSERTVYETGNGQETLYSKVSYDYDLASEFLVGAGEVTRHDDVNFGAGYGHLKRYAPQQLLTRSEK